MVKVKCVSCGGVVQVEKEDDFFTCPYCSSKLYFLSNAIFKNFYFDPILTEKYSLSLFQGELNKYGLKNIDKIKVEKIFLPFYSPKKGGTLLPLFSPVPSFFLEIDFLSSQPFLLNLDKMKSWGEVISPTKEKLLFLKNEKLTEDSIYYLPFYKITYGIEKGEKRCYVDAVSKKIYMEEFPLYLSEKQANKVLLFLISYLLIFSVTSFLIEKTLLAFFATIILSFLASPIISNYLMREK